MGIKVAADGTVSLSAPQQSAGTGLGQAGIMIGCGFASFINHRFGRRKSVVIMSIIALVGITIEMTASTFGGSIDTAHVYTKDGHFRYWQLVIGKLINSLSMGLAANVIPTYQSELAPAKWRGMIINLYQFIQIVGVVVCTASVYALSERTTYVAWQVPIGLQYIAPVLLLLGISLMPESPRWLVWNGRSAEAIEILRKLHGADSSYYPEVEVSELETAYAAEKAAHQPSLFDVFRGPDLRRTLIATGVQCLQAAQGSSYMTNYIVLFLQALGITDIFKIVMTVYVVYLVAVSGSFYLPDAFGRRPLMFLGAFICGTCLICVAAINAGTSMDPIPSSAQRTMVGLIFIWYFFFGLIWSPLTWIVSAEVCSARARETTLTVATFSGFGVNLMISLVSPYLQDVSYGNMGSNIGFLWGGFTIASIFFVYFFVPEMKGLTLEQLDYLFDHEVSTFKFQNYPFPELWLTQNNGEKTVSMAVMGRGEVGEPELEKS
ncbi:general substrate transporter [Dendrothele bispora CBS 962.96]|uniref:General substrate transporter n=1 Tax=Dendrothele bispora (strain CBS 962.96) TaxID=1314807 RepID=A0A4S8ME61_DENBC|nr:general substrate transporter [Dendrothele bispora CBS 962.96]